MLTVVLHINVVKLVTAGQYKESQDTHRSEKEKGVFEQRHTFQSRNDVPNHVVQVEEGRTTIAEAHVLTSLHTRGV